MAEELINVLDENGNKIGTKPRKIVHSNELWHELIHVWLTNKDSVLLAKRSKAKKDYANCWDVSVAGHVGVEDTPEQAAIREVKEELGIDLDPKKLEKIDYYKNTTHFPETDKDENIFMHVYGYEFDGEVDNLEYDKNEVGEIKMINFDSLAKEVQDEDKYEEYVKHGKRGEYYLKMIGHFLSKNKLQ